MNALDTIHERWLTGEPLAEHELRALLEANYRALPPGRRLRDRDAALRRLADRVYPGAPSTRAKAARLSDALTLYESTSWPRDRAATSPPPHHRGEVEGEIWRLFKRWPRVPTSLRRLQDILK